MYFLATPFTIMTYKNEIRGPYLPLFPVFGDATVPGTPITAGLKVYRFLFGLDDDHGGFWYLLKYLSELGLPDGKFGFAHPLVFLLLLISHLDSMLGRHHGEL